MHDGSQALSTLVAIGLAALVPIVLVGATSFAKIAIVFSVLRNALGTPDVPSGAIVTALAVILSAWVMTPVVSEGLSRSGAALAKIDTRDPFGAASRGALSEVVKQATQPWRSFLAHNAGTQERDLFVEITRSRPGATGDVDREGLSIVLPAFLLTELKRAFQIGVLLLLPFVVLDLLVASVLGAVGMPVLSPTALTLPLKLLLFLSVNGWAALSRALITGYRY